MNYNTISAQRIAGHELVTARVCRPQRECKPHLTRAWSRGRIRGIPKSLRLLRYPRSEPICATRPVSEHGQPHMRSPLMQLHQDPAFGGQGSGRREPFSKAAFQAMACYGSSTWIRQD